MRIQYFTGKCVAGGMSLNTRKTLINSKLQAMASKAPPPLIRSSKAFSVEIPEGSNSAKSRRSDVVPNDDLDIRSKAGQYHEAELDLDKPLGAHEEDAGLHGTGFAEDPHADSQLQQIEDPHHDDNLAKLPSDDHPASASGPSIQADALKDRFAGGEAGHTPATKGVNEARDALHDNLQGVGQDALHDNLQGVAQDSLKDNRQGVGQDALHDNLQGAGKDAIIDNQAGIGKEHLADHIVALPDTGGLKSGPSGKATESAHSEPHSSNASAPASSHSKTKPPIAAPVKKSAEDMAHEAEVLMQAKIEKEKKLEEFHSRVDAIRKTVSGINHKLNELNDDEPSKH